jgi:hypothetical protein
MVHHPVAPDTIRPAHWQHEHAAVWRAFITSSQVIPALKYSLRTPVSQSRSDVPICFEFCQRLQRPFASFSPPKTEMKCGEVLAELRKGLRTSGSH